MQLTRVRGDCNDGKTCPTVFATDRGTVVVQGSIVTDAAALAELALPSGETAVEVPSWLLPEVLANAQ